MTGARPFDPLPRSVALWIAASALVVGAGCSKSTDTLLPLYRAAKAVQVSVDIGVNYQSYGDAVRAFAIEAAVASKLNPSPEGQAFVKALEPYHDAMVAWNLKIQNAASSSMIGEPALAELATKYSVGESRALGAFKYYDADKVMQAAWVKGSAAIDAAEKQYLASKSFR